MDEQNEVPSQILLNQISLFCLPLLIKDVILYLEPELISIQNKYIRG